MIIQKEEKIKVVSKEWAEQRKKEKIPLWEGWIQEMPSKDRKYIVVTLFNKYRQSDFSEQFKYEI